MPSCNGAGIPCTGGIGGWGGGVRGGNKGGQLELGRTGDPGMGVLWAPALWGEALRGKIEMLRG